MRDVLGSDRDQRYVEYILEAPRMLLKQCVTTMSIGELAYCGVMFQWAAREIAPIDKCRGGAAILLCRW
jgi:hypothetical protein